VVLRALFDANVLYSVYLRDVIAESGISKLFDPLWSSHILDETERALMRRLPKAGENFPRIRTLLHETFPDSLVNVTSTNGVDFGCLDPDDNLIVAAAVIGKADALVTFNMKHFPSDLSQRFGINLTTPDHFLNSVFEENQELASVTISNLLESYTQAHMDVETLAKRLSKAGCPNLGKRLLTF
jgi:predicted nucleic acid-binding protein